MPVISRWPRFLHEPYAYVQTLGALTIEPIFRPWVHLQLSLCSNLECTYSCAYVQILGAFTIETATVVIVIAKHPWAVQIALLCQHTVVKRCHPDDSLFLLYFFSPFSLYILYQFTHFCVAIICILLTSLHLLPVNMFFIFLRSFLLVLISSDKLIIPRCCTSSNALL